jgi:hypothetical protein
MSHHPTRAVPIEDLSVAVDELLDVLPELVALIPATGAVLDTEPGVTGRSRVVSPAPWNAQAALMYFEIAGDARRFESLLTLRLFRRAKFRPDTGSQTAECLRRLPELIRYGRSEDLPDLDLIDVTTCLQAWPRRVRVLLGQERPGDAPPRPVPGGARCPHCDQVLVLSPGWRALEANASAECRGCQDDFGAPLRWPVTERIGLPVHAELVTVEEARTRLGIPANTLYSWKRRGRIHPYGADEHGRRTYRVSDLRALADAVDDTAS